MRRCWLGICLLVGLLAGSVGVTRGMKAIHDPIAVNLTQAASLSREGKADEARALALQARSAWESHREFVSAFADQSPMEEIDTLFAALEARPAGTRAYAGLCLQLVQRTQAMADAHLPRWWNLL